MTALTYVAAHPSGEFLAVASRDGWLTVWEPSTDCIVALHKLPAMVNKVGWLADGSRLVATDGDRLRIWWAGARVAVCEFCQGLYPAEAFACVHCGAPPRGRATSSRGGA